MWFLSMDAFFFLIELVLILSHRQHVKLWILASDCNFQLLYSDCFYLLNSFEFVLVTIVIVYILESSFCMLFFILTVVAWNFLNHQLLRHLACPLAQHLSLSFFCSTCSSLPLLAILSSQYIKTPSSVSPAPQACQIAFKNSGCLSCHSSVSPAPQACQIAFEK